MKKHKLFKINDTYYMSNLEPIYEEDIIKLVDERDKYKQVIDKIKEYIKERTEFGEYDHAYPGVLNQDEVRHINRLLEEIE